MNNDSLSPILQTCVLKNHCVSIRETGAGYILSLGFDREPVAAKILRCSSSGVATSKWIKNEIAWFSKKLNEEFR